MRLHFLFVECKAFAYGKHAALRRLRFHHFVLVLVVVVLHNHFVVILEAERVRRPGCRDEVVVVRRF